MMCIGYPLRYPFWFSHDITQCVLCAKECSNLAHLTRRLSLGFMHMGVQVLFPAPAKTLVNVEFAGGFSL